MICSPVVLQTLYKVRGLLLAMAMLYDGPQDRKLAKLDR